MNRLELLRNWLTDNKLDCFIIPSSDPHQSEYVSEYWGSRQWLTGFTGSAARVAVTHKNAALWTDSRYFIQAATELDESLFQLQKDGLPDTPTLSEWIISETKPDTRIGLDGRLFTKKQFDDLQASLPNHQLILSSDPFEKIWRDRTPLPTDPVIFMNEEYVGETSVSKIERLRPTSGTLLLSTLDDIAWLLNMRGSDIKCNPLFLSYVAIEQQNTILFIDPIKLDREHHLILKKQGITVCPYSEWEGYLENLTGEIIANPSQLNINSWQKIKNPTPETPAYGNIAMAKSQKNETEISGFRSSMIVDGLAICKFMMWLEQQDSVTEYEASLKLHEFRALSPHFQGDSFEAIVGYASNGAIVHYAPSAKSAATIGRDNLLLIDSGAQYDFGTTDITRTYHLGGNPTQEQRQDYTDVLKGLIDLSRITFPEGTRGAQLDVLARQHMWQRGTNYLHGTGHGVGHFLCVHEGPQSIRMNENPVAIKQGMVQSIEPGIYREGQYGIRLENLVVALPAEHDGYLKFETLTLAPFDLGPIDLSQMNRHHIEWLNDYHATVYKWLSPFLNKSEREWLSNKTRELDICVEQ